MFLTEKELKEAFWRNYNYSGRALRYQFECPIREGCADLVTVEKYQDNFQINAFEFKLNDMKKVLRQAKGNAEVVNKSWIVVPEEKAEVVKNRYLAYLKENRIGAITVAESGRWEVLIRAPFQRKIRMNQAAVNLMMRGY